MDNTPLPPPIADLLIAAARELFFLRSAINAVVPRSQRPLPSQPISSHFATGFFHRLKNWNFLRSCSFAPQMRGLFQDTAWLRPSLLQGEQEAVDQLPFRSCRTRIFRGVFLRKTAPFRRKSFIFLCCDVQSLSFLRRKFLL